MKEFIGNCISNPFKDKAELEWIIDKARKITRSAFLKECPIDPRIEKEMYKRAADFEFYRYNDVYFYRHSRIEHFYR